MSDSKSSQLKIALLVITGLALLIIGFNFLKGNKLFSKEKNYYAIFNTAKGLGQANKVILLGVDVGKVESIDFINNYEQIKVNFVVDKNIKIPEDSKVMIEPGIPGFGSPVMQLQLGNGDGVLKPGDQVIALEAESLGDRVAEVSKNIEPTVNNLNTALKRIDSVAAGLNLLVSGRNADNIEASLASLNRTLQNFNATSKKLDALVEKQSPQIDATIGNLSSISNNLKSNEAKINDILDNFSTTSQNLSELELKQTLDKANATFAKLNATIDEINNGDGSLSLLINDAELYNNLNNTARDLDRLILQIKEDPNAVVPNISVFGRKKK